MPLESKFKTKLIKELESLFPGIEIFHMDPNETQGICDLLLLYGPRWAMLEGKREHDSPRRPNQEYYVEYYNKLSYASFISPENKDEVIRDLQQAFRRRRPTRLP